MLKKFIQNLINPLLGGVPLHASPQGRGGSFPEKNITWVSGHITGILKDCNLYTSEAYTNDIEPEFTITTTLN